jgi:hypothetical protein
LTGSSAGFCLSFQLLPSASVLPLPAKIQKIPVIFRAKGMKKAACIENNQKSALIRQRKTRKHSVHGLFRNF